MHNIIQYNTLHTQISGRIQYFISIKTVECIHLFFFLQKVFYVFEMSVQHKTRNKHMMETCLHYLENHILLTIWLVTSVSGHFETIYFKTTKMTQENGTIKSMHNI